MRFTQIAPIIVECALGQTRYGVEYGGYFIHRMLRNCNYPLHLPYIIRDLDFNDTMKSVKFATMDALRNNRMPLVLGGDHSISYGSLKGVLDFFKNNIHVIWIDSHTDINTWDSSQTKNMHGMPISSLMGLNTGDWGLNNDYILKPEQLTYYGINSIDSYEDTLIKELSINCIHRDEVDFIDINPMIPNNVPIHISFDVDVLDKSLVPCTGTPVDYGLFPEDVLRIIQQYSPRIVSMDIVEYNPILGNERDNKKTLESIVESIGRI